MICERCEVQHEGDYGSGRFCSAKCSRGFSTSRSRQAINEKVALSLSKPRQCRICGADAHRRTGGTGRSCSLHKSKPLSERTWDELKTDDSKKLRLQEELGHRCEVCKNTEWMGHSIPIELDHIDGHPGHSDRQNLRLICPNCHAQTPTYKGKNVGKHGATERQKRMAKYPSYRVEKIASVT